MTHFVVETAGPRTLIEDAGRRGWADLGISGCGAWDRRAYLDGARPVSYTHLTLPTTPYV